MSLQEVGDELGVSDQTVRRWVKAGELAAYKPGKEYRIKASDLEEFLQTREVGPKAQAPLPLEEAGTGEAERRLSRVPEALGDWARSRALKYEEEVRNPNSPHFKTATAATLWLAGLQEERAMWSDWTRKWGTDLTPPRRGVFEGGGVESMIGTLGDAFSIMGHLMSFRHVERRALKRIEAMQDTPDELAARRLEEATAEAEGSAERLEEWRRAASG